MAHLGAMMPKRGADEPAADSLTRPRSLVLDAGDQLRLRRATTSLRFEGFLGKLAVRLQGLPPERLDEAIRESLQGLVETLDVDRTSLQALSEDGSSHRTTHRWSRPGIRPAPYGVNLAAALPWYTEHVRRGRMLVLPRLPEGLPQEARAERMYVASTDMTSQVILPMTVDREVVGSLEIATFHRGHEIPAELLPRLELVASVFASALYRKRAEKRLSEAKLLNRAVLTELDQTNTALERSLSEVRALTERLQAETVLLHREARRSKAFEGMVGTSPALDRVLQQIEQVAATDAPVLILGETGTGKELVARAIHDRSPRKGRPLVTVNCAALPAALMESELFGYERGAFTGATTRTLGRFEFADGAAILLDEIGEMPVEVQPKLLRVLEGGAFERLGSSRTVKVDVRIIAASNRDLEKEMKSGRFRADLFYRLNVFPISVPPLRERAEDIPLLVWHFIAQKQGRLSRSVEQVPERFMRELAGYSWPGNVRQLENVIERALIETEGATLAEVPGFRDRSGTPSA